MASSDPYAHLDRLNGCLGAANGSIWLKGCMVPVIGLIMLFAYIAMNGPP